MRWFKRLCLRIAMGRDYEYMRRTMAYDPRLRGAHTVDIVVRQDAVEKRIEADWLKRLCDLIVPRPPLPKLPPQPPGSEYVYLGQGKNP